MNTTEPSPGSSGSPDFKRAAIALRELLLAREAARKALELRELFFAYLAEQVPDLDPLERDRTFDDVLEFAEGDYDLLISNLTTALLEFGLDPTDFTDRFMGDRGFIEGEIVYRNTRRIQTFNLVYVFSDKLKYQTLPLPQED